MMMKAQYVNTSMFTVPKSCFVGEVSVFKEANYLTQTFFNHNKGD